jgi:[ribosomal protein S18]-alanine N-acetyltransferase
MLLIREFRPIDLKRIYEIECRSFKDPYNAMSLLNLYEMYYETFLVAQKNGFIVGYVISRIVDIPVTKTPVGPSTMRTRSSGRTGHILAIAVDPPYRAQRIGTSLMDAVTRQFKKQDVINVWLEVRVSNTSARHFYKKLDFKETGILRSYYSDGEDAVVLKKALFLD